MLAEPNGAVHLHDKDIPTAWEQHFYVGGDDDGTPRCGALGATVGLMSGWEWARYGTAARVRDARARLVIGGMCWPSMPLNWPRPAALVGAARARRSGASRPARCRGRSRG